jgi:hypothetical protein
MMKRISVIWTPGTEMVYATNPSGEGLFSRLPNQGAYNQVAGNSQTPLFRTPAQMMRYLRRNFVVNSTVRMIRGSAIGW